MCYASMALYFYDGLKTYLDEALGKFWTNLFREKYVSDKCIHFI